MGGGGNASKYHCNVAFTRLEQLANKDDKKVAMNISSVPVKKHQIWPPFLLLAPLVPC